MLCCDCCCLQPPAALAASGSSEAAVKQLPTSLQSQECDFKAFLTKAVQEVSKRWRTPLPATREPVAKLYLSASLRCVPADCTTCPAAPWLPALRG